MAVIGADLGDFGLPVPLAGRKRTEHETPLYPWRHAPACRGAAEPHRAVPVVLRLGADVNRADILGRTALHRAVQDGAADAARLLIAYGANLDAKDWQKRTPLDLAEAGDRAALTLVIREKTSLRLAQRVKAVKLGARYMAREAGEKIGRGGRT